MTRPFIMVDLETFGSVPGCAIAAIGAVKAHPDGWVSDRIHIIVSRADCRAHGLHEDPKTIKWWSRQSLEAQATLRLSDDPQTAVPLRDALEALNAFVRRAADTGPVAEIDVYGNGSDFDNAILAVAARAADVPLAWPFWRNRCYRTLKARAPGTKLRRLGTHHDALADATTQAEHLGRINAALTLSADTIVAVNAFLTHMADRYRHRTARRFLGLRMPTLSRHAAMAHALATFEVSAADMPFGHPDATWDRAAAHDMVDEDLQHWEAA